MFGKVNDLLDAGAPVTLVAYGDSICEAGDRPDWHGGASCFEQNWAQQLGRLLHEVYPDAVFAVKNYGVGGQNAYEGLGRFRWLKPFNPDLVLVEFGTNDVGYHPLPPEATALAIRTLVKGILHDYGADIVVLGPGGGNPLESEGCHLQETIDHLRVVADETGAPFVDIRAAILEATENGRRWTEFHPSAQDVHPNDRGHALWAKTVLEVLMQHVQRDRG